MSEETDRPACRQIDLDAYPRRKAYEYFRAFETPITSMTVQLDVTSFRRFIEEKQLRFFATLSFVVTRAANLVPEFRHRIDGGVLVEFERVLPSFTVLSAENTMNFANGVFTNDFGADYRANLELIERAVLGLDQVGGPKHQGQIFITNLPWFSFTAIHHPCSRQNASIPIFSFGKIHREGDRAKLPFSMQTSHALVDGYHMGCLLECVSECLEKPRSLIA
jgi:chloramphenicol O-acetyltransferase type A